MPDISISDEAISALRKFLDKYRVHSYSAVILHLTGVKRLKPEPDPEKERIVMADPLFGSAHHQHSAWGADCPVCKNYFFEDCDTMPLPEEERPKECDSCGQKIRLIYPWEAAVGMIIG